MKNTKFSLLVLSQLTLLSLYANNVQVTNVSLTAQNAISNTYQVKFDISWENSWRTSTLESNYDAVWIFVKYRESISQNWLHANIVTIGFVEPSGGDLLIPNDAIGAFLYRDANGIGDINFTNVELRMSYNVSDDAILEVSVYAIEMVYIPGGQYLLGDGSITPEGNFQTGNIAQSYTLSSEAALTLGGTIASNLSNNNNVGMSVSDDYSYLVTQTLPAAYPKGFAPFFVMKYEISQGQYVAFLNSITPAGGVARFPNSFGANNNTINNLGYLPQVYTTDTPDRASNYIGWPDVAAYADWSGLRPMSELEFEQICRGTRPPLTDEYAWGNLNIFNQTYIYAASGAPNETMANVGLQTGNAIYFNTRGTAGPRRCGIAAGSKSNPTREESGASYYGVMEMSGNVWETVVTTGNTQGRAFNGLNHGNGIIGSTGNSTVAGWPAIADGVGTGVRGGGHTNPTLRLRTSSRNLSNINIAPRFSDVGGRLVRSRIN